MAIRYCSFATRGYHLRQMCIRDSFRNVYIFGQEYTIAKALTKITGGVTFVRCV